MVSVVIPTVHGDAVATALRSLTGPAVQEVIVVDNGSPAGLALLELEEPRTRVLRNDWNTGFAPACAQGAAAASAPYLLFLNDDAVLPPGGLDELLRVADADERGAIWGPRIESPDGTVESCGDLFSWSGFFPRLTVPPPGDPAPVFAVTGACMLVRREVYERVGGFETSYFAYSEDTDLCWRARLAGWEVRVVPTVCVTHVRSATTRRVLRPEEIRYLTFRNRFRTILANAAALTIARMLPLHILGCLAAAILFLMTGRPASGAAVVRALWWPVGNRDVLLEQRRHAQRLRTLPDDELIRAELRAGVDPVRTWERFRAFLFRWEP